MSLINSNPRYALDPQGRLTVRVDGIIGLYSLRDLGRRHGIALSSVQSLMRAIKLNDDDPCRRFEVNLPTLHQLWANDVARCDDDTEWTDALNQAVTRVIDEPTYIIEESIENFFEITRIAAEHATPGGGSPSPLKKFEIADLSVSPSGE